MSRKNENQSIIQFQLDNLHESKAPLYCKYPRQIKPQRASVTLDCSTGIVRADYNSELGNSVECDVFNSIKIEWEVPTAVKASYLEEVLRSEAAIKLLKRVYQGHELVWDGSNYVGELDANAGEASILMQQLLYGELGNEQACWNVMEAKEWIEDGFDIDDIWPEGKSIGAIVKTEKAYAEEQNIYLYGSISNVLIDKAVAYIYEMQPGLRKDQVETLIQIRQITAQQGNEYMNEFISEET